MVTRDETAVEALRALCVLLIFAIIVVTAPTWGPLLDDEPIVEARDE